MYESLCFRARVERLLRCIKDEDICFKNLKSQKA